MAKLAELTEVGHSEVTAKDMSGAIIDLTTYRPRQMTRVVGKAIERWLKTKPESLICENGERRASGMKGSKIKEHVCPACNGTGYPSRSSRFSQAVEFIPPSASLCDGKGENADAQTTQAARRPARTWRAWIYAKVK